VKVNAKILQLDACSEFVSRAESGSGFTGTFIGRECVGRGPAHASSRIRHRWHHRYAAGFRELLPILKTIDLGGISTLAADFEEFSTLAGIDPAKVTAAVLGIKVAGLSLRGGAIVAEGLDLDAKAIAAAAEKKHWKFETTTPGPMHRITRVSPGADAAAPAQTSELFFASLGPKRVVAGDSESVSAAIANAGAAAAKRAVSATLQAALKQTAVSSLARFALVIPADLREFLDSQGDLFKQLAAVKVIFGTVDLSADQTAAIKAMLSTNSKDDATQLETGLKSLITLGKSFLGGDSGQIGKLLDQVQIGARESDVTLSLVIPKALLDQLTKPAAPK
jgi:hypothetical protein